LGFFQSYIKPISYAISVIKIGKKLNIMYI
jgi:hypothetical protein